MLKINEILSKKVVKNDETKRINTKWEIAKEFGDYVGLETIFVLKLFKNYGQNEVLNIRSFLKDAPYDPSRGLPGLAVWKLKDNAQKLSGEHSKVSETE